jgi:hypothetical protein
MIPPIQLLVVEYIYLYREPKSQIKKVSMVAVLSAGNEPIQVIIHGNVTRKLPV